MMVTYAFDGAVVLGLAVDGAVCFDACLGVLRKGHYCPEWQDRGEEGEELHC